MKVLLLGNSQDTGEWFEGGKRRHEIVQDRLAAEFGAPVDIAVKPYWPSDRLPSLMERWVAETEPDMVYINVVTFPFAYESLPLRFKRILGRFGPAVGDAGLRFAGSKRWSHNAVFRKARRLGQATIGGDTHFSCEQVIDSTSRAIRTVLRRESAFLVVEGPLGRGEQEPTRRQRRRKEARRLVVHRALRTLCQELNVYYIGSDAPMPRGLEHVAGTTVGDGMHFNAAGHARVADDMFEIMRDAWQAHLAMERSDRTG